MKRQGELLIVKIKSSDSAREDLKQQKHLTLAEGETTGHKHQLSLGTLYKEKWSNTLYFEVPKKQVSTLTHPDHKSLTFDEGLYKVITQREYTERGLRQVKD